MYTHIKIMCGQMHANTTCTLYCGELGLKHAAAVVTSGLEK